ncbi:class I SAM-dependent methyltransferase [Paracoccaceae bacterium]|nr:class I SAM-dependent methyltransferase [Paracoccaceae bacterium]
MQIDECENCHQTGRLETIQDINPSLTFCITSDGERLSGDRFQRVLCEYCGCLFCTYTPDNAVSAHYLTKYDLSEATQNNFIIHNDNLVRKKNELEQFLVDHLEAQSITPSNILEIACGNGELLESIGARYKNAFLTGIDPNLEAKLAVGRTNYIRQFFKPELVSGNFYDLVIAHSFLNRSSTLPELKNIRKLMIAGGILSVEVMLLEDSFHAIKTWDHSHWFTGCTFENWLHVAGFEIIDSVNNNTTKHYICRAEERDLYNIDGLNPDLNNTRAYIERYEGFWESIDRTEFLGKYKYLFGAGMYSSILLNDLNLLSEFEFIIDELKTGTHHGIPIVSLEIAAKNPGNTLIFTRNSFVDVISRKLRSYNIRHEIYTLPDLP